MYKIICSVCGKTETFRSKQIAQDQGWSGIQFFQPVKMTLYSCPDDNCVKGITSKFEEIIFKRKLEKKKKKVDQKEKELSNARQQEETVRQKYRDDRHLSNLDEFE